MSETEARNARNNTAEIVLRIISKIPF